MSEHFIKTLNIENYKCFHNFEAKGFSRVNLISGRNNVGKTALLEAGVISLHHQSINHLMIALFSFYFKRYKLDLIDLKKDLNHIINDHLNNISPVSITSNNHKIDSKYLNNNLYYTKYNSTEMFSIKEIHEILNLVSNDSPEVGYIGSIRDTQASLITSLSKLQLQDKENYVFDLIRKFDPYVEEVKIIGGTSIKFKYTSLHKNSQYRDLQDFGDGLRHYLSILIALYNLENNHFFIDEIDSGIYYTALPDLWEHILTISKQQNTQIFATTHSLECIQAYAHTAEKLNYQDITFTTLIKNKSGEIKAIVRDYDTFIGSIKDGNEVRGW